MGFEPNQRSSKVEAINEFADWMKSSLDEAWAALAKSKEDMVWYYNQHQTPAPNFTVGKKVFLDASDISTTWPMKKFAHHYFRPFSVVHPVSLHAYHLKLPQSMLWLHPVFHVVKLMPAPPNPIEGQRTWPWPPPKIVEGEERYEVEEIINSRMRGRRLQYLVQWKGYGHEETSWISEGDLDTPDLIMDFHGAHPTAPKYINVLMFGHMGFQPW
jgi:hypothetical protein